MLDTLTVDHFKDKLQQTCKLRSRGHAAAVDITLVQAEEQPQRGYPGAARRRPFSLIFLGSPQAVLPQATYCVAIPGLGELELFVVPVGPTADRTMMRYQIVFN